MGQPAARVGDFHTCPMASPATPPVPHVGGPVLPPGGITVLIGGQPAARMGDMCACVGPPDVIARGEPTVLICGQPAARMTDNTAHGGLIAFGCPTVIIGTSPGMAYIEQLIFNGVLSINGSDEYVDAVKRDSETIANTNSGKNTLDSIAQSGRAVEIEDWQNPFEPGNSAATTRDGLIPPHGSGLGADTRIEYRPNEPGRFPASPSVAGLNHELGHANNNAYGNNAVKVDRPDATVRGGISNMEEGNTIASYDNPFRIEMGLPPRNGHGHMPQQLESTS